MQASLHRIGAPSRLRRPRRSPQPRPHRRPHLARRRAARCSGDIGIGIPTPRRGAAARPAPRSIRICRPIIPSSRAPHPANAPCRRPPSASRRPKSRSTSSNLLRFLSRAPSRISSPQPGARRRPPPPRRPSGRRRRKHGDPHSAIGETFSPAQLIVAGAAVLIAGVFLHVALRMFQDRAPPNNSPAPPSVRHKRQRRPGLAGIGSAKTQLGTVDPAGSRRSAPIAPVTTPSAPRRRTPRIVRSGAGSPPADAGCADCTPPHQHQSSLPYSADVTGSLPRRVPPPCTGYGAGDPLGTSSPAAAPAMVAGKLPATIGGPTLRAAAIAGDAAARI